ncbi:hypothetical protein [Streptomyces sp. NPDC056672]|uniref:hypothetical protein n=1 Tax=Streptomyces sp. NPDC056672 TaxID=3345906 RepID=UPI0036C6B6CB
MDGLDEMDPTLSDGPPARSRGVVEQLSAYRDSDRLTPMAFFYRTRHCNALPVVDTLIEGVRITIAPVGAPAVTAHLSAGTGDLPRWQPSRPVALCAGVLSVLADRFAVLLWVGGICDFATAS